MRSIRKTLSADFIKETIDPLSFYTHELSGAKIKPGGAWVDADLCPFHNDRSRGSFKINLVTGGFKCFACNAVGGDIIDFVRALHGLSFVEALKKLSEEWGVY